MSLKHNAEWWKFKIMHLRYTKGDLIKLLYEAIRRADKAEDKQKKQE